MPSRAGGRHPPRPGAQPGGPVARVPARGDAVPGAGGVRGHAGGGARVHRAAARRGVHRVPAAGPVRGAARTVPGAGVAS
ncbi:hypothetical protein DMB42_30470 [Nonomuraea sp. WAC 01424]|nr:hypothetical protein DMB42_30470 [Nonomuraea sp. WAC 01424]